MATSRYIVQNKNENKEKKWLLPFLIVFFFGFGFAFSVGGFSYGRFFTIALLGISALLSIEDGFCTLMFAFSFASMLKIDLASISMLAVLYLILLLKVALKGEIHTPPLALFCFFVFAIIQALSILVYDAGYTRIISTLLNIGFVMIMSGYFAEHQSKLSHMLPRASLFFISGATVMLLLSDIFPHLPRMAHPTQHAALVASQRYAATVLDPNELAQIILIAIGLGIAILPTIKSKFAKILLLAIGIYIGITGIRTNSKSYVITILFILVFLVFIYTSSTAKKEGFGKAAVKLLPIALGTVVLLYVLVIYVVIPVFEARGGEQASMLTNRENIWRNYLAALGQRLDVAIIGCGGGNTTHIMKLVGRNTSGAPHNSYLEYLIQFGVIGIALIIGAWKTMFGQIRNKLSSYYAISLASFLITAFSISVNSSECPYILLTLLSLPLNEEAQTINLTNIKNNLTKSKYIN